MHVNFCKVLNIDWIYVSGEDFHNDMKINTLSFMGEFLRFFVDVFIYTFFMLF